MGTLSQRTLPACILFGTLFASCQPQVDSAGGAPLTGDLAAGSEQPEITTVPVRSAAADESVVVDAPSQPASESVDSTVDVVGETVEVTAEDVADAGGSADGAYDEGLARLLESLPWVAPFLGDDVFRRVVLLAYHINPNAVDAADLDDDGDLDLLWAQAARDRVVFFPQILPGTFSSSPVVIADTSLTQGPLAVTAEDVDGDGRTDVVSYNGKADDITVFYQIAFGVYKRTPTVLIAPAGMAAWAVHAEDLDGDGDRDISACGQDGAVIAAFEQVRPQEFEFAPHLK